MTILKKKTLLAIILAISPIVVYGATISVVPMGTQTSGEFIGEGLYQTSCTGSYQTFAEDGIDYFGNPIVQCGVIDSGTEWNRDIVNNPNNKYLTAHFSQVCGNTGVSGGDPIACDFTRFDNIDDARLSPYYVDEILWQQLEFPPSGFSFINISNGELVSGIAPISDYVVNDLLPLVSIAIGFYLGIWLLNWTVARFLTRK